MPTTTADVPGLVQRDVEELAKAWKAAGARLGFDVSANFGHCAASGCHSLAFAALLTDAAERPVCLRHYAEIDARIG